MDEQVNLNSGELQLVELALSVLVRFIYYTDWKVCAIMSPLASQEEQDVLQDAVLLLAKLRRLAQHTTE